MHPLIRQWAHQAASLPLPLLNAAGALACFSLIVFAWYLQFGLGLEPCPLCLLQRWLFWLLAAAFVLAALLPPNRWRWFGALLIVLISGIGTAVAGRHVWLQNLPPGQVPACGPDLFFMLETQPLFQALWRTLQGSGDCAVIDWTFLGLSIPAWALVWFVLLGVYGLLVNLLPRVR